jgi:hypothetical protein
MAILMYTATNTVSSARRQVATRNMSYAIIVITFYVQLSTTTKKCDTISLKGMIISEESSIQGSERASVLRAFSDLFFLPCFEGLNSVP